MDVRNVGFKAKGYGDSFKVFGGVLASVPHVAYEVAGCEGAKCYIGQGGTVAGDAGY